MESDVGVSVCISEHVFIVRGNEVWPPVLYSAGQAIFRSGSHVILSGMSV